MEKELRNAAILNGLANAEETQETKENYGNKQMIEKIAVEGTPFHIIRADEKCFGVYGRIRITDAMDTVPEVEDKLTKFNWEVTLAIVIQITEFVAGQIVAEALKPKKIDTRTIDDISKGGVA